MRSKPSRVSCLSLLVILLFVFVIHTGAQSQSQTTPQFVDVTTSSGIKFTHFKGNKGISINLEEFGPGVCVSDFNRDGWQDIYVVNGRDRYDRGITVKNALYRNNGDGTFTDLTDKAGVPGTGYGLGCAWGDYDNDGFPDLFVTQFGNNVLYHNNGDGTFTDVTARRESRAWSPGQFIPGPFSLTMIATDDSTCMWAVMWLS